MRFSVDPAGEAAGEYLGTFPTGHGRIIHPEHPAPWVSAVAILEMFNPDRQRFEELVRSRFDTSDKPDMVEWLSRWEVATDAVRAEYPELNPDRTALRMRVYENSSADVPLPLSVLQGRYDTRYGRLATGNYGPLN